MRLFSTTFNQDQIVSSTRDVTYLDAYKLFIIQAGATLTFDVSTATGTKQAPGFTFSVYFEDPTSVFTVKSDDGVFAYVGSENNLASSFVKLTVESDGGNANVWVNTWYNSASPGQLPYSSYDSGVTTVALNGVTAGKFLYQQNYNNFTITASLDVDATATPGVFTIPFTTFSGLANSSLTTANAGGKLWFGPVSQNGSVTSNIPISIYLAGSSIVVNVADVPTTFSLVIILTGVI